MMLHHKSFMCLYHSPRLAEQFALFPGAELSQIIMPKTETQESKLSKERRLKRVLKIYDKNCNFV